MIRSCFYARSSHVAQTKVMGFRWRDWRDCRKKFWTGRRISWLTWRGRTARLCTHRNRGARGRADGARRNRRWTCCSGRPADENQLVINRDLTCPKSVELNLVQSYYNLEAWRLGRRRSLVRHSAHIG